MATTTLDLHVRVVTYDPAGDALVPVPGATVTCRNSTWFRDPTLSASAPATDGDGKTKLEVSFDEGDRDGLNPYFEIAIPQAQRKVPAASPAQRQLDLPEEWMTRHYVNRRVQDIGAYTDSARPLELRVGVKARVRVGVTDFDSSDKRNPLALPRHTQRVNFFDKDWFIFDGWNPDDDVPAWVFDPAASITSKTSGERVPVADAKPRVPFAWEAGAPAAPVAVIDPPGFPLARLGGGSFSTPGAMATDVHGFVFVIDGSVVRRFYPDGTLAETITRPGLSNFSDPRALAVDQYRHLFVAEAGANRVSMFRLSRAEQALTGASAGRYVHITDRGAGSAGALSGPRGLAVVPNRVVEGDELLAVADSGNHRVQVFTIVIPAGGRLTPSPTCTLSNLADFGTPGAPLAPADPVPAAALGTPVGIAADRAGRIYVADERAHRVSRWDPDAARGAWAHAADWEKAGGGSGAGIREFLYVADTGNDRVQRLDLADGADNGRHLNSWVPAGGFHADAVACDARGEVYAADATAKRIYRGTPYTVPGAALGIAADPRLVATWTDAAEAPHMRSPAYLAFGPDGKLWVIDTGNDRVLAFARDAAGEYVADGAPLSGAPLGTPTGVAFDPEGNLWIADGTNDKLRRYDAARAHQAEIGGPGALDNQLNHPAGLCFVQLTEPVAYVADRDNDRIVVLERDGSAFTPPLTTALGTAFKKPEDVTADDKGSVYVADTGNSRVVRFPRKDDGTLDTPVDVPIFGLSTPSGIAADEDGNLLVTDRAKNEVLHVTATGLVLARWDLQGVLAQDVGAGTVYYPELARQVVFDTPSRAVFGAKGLMAVADTGHHCVRLVRVRTEITGNLIDLQEDEPELYVNFRSEADRSVLGLKLKAADVGIICDDDPHTVEHGMVEDFGRDEYVPAPLALTRSRAANAAVNALRAVSTAWQWLGHLTRADDASFRMDADRDLKLSIDLEDESGSEHGWDKDHFNLASKDTDGRGLDAWDDSTVVHEMSHWVFDKSVFPRIPFERKGGTHGKPDIRHPSTAALEGYAEYHQLFWGSEYAPTDRVRGFPLGWGDSLTWVRDIDKKQVKWLYGSPTVPQAAKGVAQAAPPAPDWSAPGLGVGCEGYFAHTLYQVHRALVDPEMLFADQPQFWYGYNSLISQAKALVYADVVRAPMRMFPDDPSDDQWENGTREWLRQVLRKAHLRGDHTVDVIRGLFELNNVLMPKLRIAASTAPGTDIGAATTIPVATSRAFEFRLTDPEGEPMAGRNLVITIVTPGDFDPFAGAAPAVTHGRVDPAPAATTLQRATDADGKVTLTYNAPAAVPGTPEKITVSYQPDFDADGTLAPPARGDDRDTVLRKLYLYELRGANKAWAGTGNNLGAIVTRSLTVTVTP
jgi:sugar lactone lactonase YvrE